jgi:hypothetical protein
MRFYNKLKSAMLVAASLFCFHAAFADTALIAWGNCTTDSIEGTSVVNKLVGNEGDTAEGFVLSLTGNPSKTYSAANKLSVPLPNGETGERTTIKLSNGAENTLTLPEGKVATKVTFYSYVNYNVADKGQWGRTSYWASVGGQDYTVETADTLTNWLATKTTYTADEPDARSFELDRVTEIKFKNTGEQPCVVIAVEYEDNAPAVVVNPATLTFNTDTIYVQEGDSTQVQFTYTPDSITWQQAAQLLYGAEPVVSAEPFGIIRYDEETLAIKGYYPGECNLIIELADSAVLIPVVVTAKPAEEEVATSDPINGDWTSIKSWIFEGLADSIYTNKVAATYSTEKVSIANTDCNLGTDEFEGLAFQGADKFFYYNGGLYQGNGGGRKVGVLNMEAGAVITVVTTDAAFALATTDIAALNSELSSGETFVYNVTADGNVGFTMTRYCVIKSISVVAPKTSKVAAPTAEITKVLGTSREVTLASDNSRAVITYFLGDASEGVVYDAPFNVAESTELRAVAAVGAVVSDTLIMTIEAGTEVQLAGVTYTYGTIADSLATEYEANNLKDIIVHTDQTATLCKPEAKIVYTYKPLDETTGRVDDSKAVTDTVASGTTLYGLGIGQLTAVAVSENYANSEETHLWLKKPAELTEIWSIDFDSLAVAMGASGLEKGGAVTFGAVNFSGKFRENSTCDFAIVQVADSTGNANDSILNANFGVQNETTWLLRAGQGSYWGLYNNNSGDRAFGVCNLLKNQIVHVKFQDASQVTFLYGQAEQDLALTSGNDVYYKATADGMLNVAMNRYYTIHQIGVYQSSDLTNIPTISVVSANNGDRTLEIACTTKGADIFYATATTTDSTTEWSEYIPYTEPITISETTTFKTYATYQDVDSDESEAITVEAGTVISLNEPIIKFVEKTASGKKFEITVDNSELIDSNPQGIYYTLPGAEPVLYSGPFEVADTTYGWMTAISQIEGYEASGLAYRYLDARESYNETYEAVTAETAEMPAEAADLEIADIATLNASLNAAFKPSGRIYFHKAVHAGYNALVLPFGMTTANLENGTVKVTDEAGTVLTRGTDYEVVRLQATTEFSTLATDLAARKNVHTGNLVANTNSYLLKVSDALVGQELIFVSGENAQNLSINKVDLSSLAGEGKWLVKNNATFAPVASEVPVYLVNEDGSALVLHQAGTVVPPYSYAVIGDSATVASTSVIPLIEGATSIESLNKELIEQGVIFDLMGRQVDTPKAGTIYLRNGKKFMQR